MVNPTTRFHRRASEQNMSQDRTIHTASPGGNRYHDLDVYYAKASMNYWNYE